MARRSSRPTDFKDCTCSKCGIEAHSKPGTKHRRCGNKPKIGSKLPAKERGEWS